jgi:hypothetical protein
MSQSQQQQQQQRQQMRADTLAQPRFALPLHLPTSECVFCLAIQLRDPGIHLHDLDRGGGAGDTKIKGLHAKFQDQANPGARICIGVSCAIRLNLSTGDR